MNKAFLVIVLFFSLFMNGYSQTFKKIHVIVNKVTIDSSEIVIQSTIKLQDSIGFREFLGDGYTLNCDNWFTNHMVFIEKYNQKTSKFSTLKCLRDIDVSYLDTVTAFKIDTYGKGAIQKTIVIPLKYLNVGTYRFTVKQYYLTKENVSHFELSNKKIVVLKNEDFRWIEYHSNR